MIYSVTEAAKVVGKSRMTIIRAIAAGTLSASRSEPGAPWTIDAAELARVFPGSDHDPNTVPDGVLPRSGDDRPQNRLDDASIKDALIAETAAGPPASAPDGSLHQRQSRPHSGTDLVRPAELFPRHV